MSDEDAPKRRWYQYRLRTLLVLVVLASIGMSWFAVKLQQVQPGAPVKAAPVSERGQAAVAAAVPDE